jgi:hypothetical protein
MAKDLGLRIAGEREIEKEDEIKAKPTPLHQQLSKDSKQYIPAHKNKRASDLGYLVYIL